MDQSVSAHRRSDAAIRVALAQHRVDRRAEHLGVTRVEVAVLVRLGLLRVVGHRKALGLQLLDGRVQLRHGRRNVGQLDAARANQGAGQSGGKVGAEWSDEARVRPGKRKRISELLEVTQKMLSI